MLWLHILMPIAGIRRLLLAVRIFIWDSSFLSFGLSVAFFFLCLY